jgi:hypothetical protein
MIARPHSATAAAFESVARGVATALGWRHVVIGSDEGDA